MSRQYPITLRTDLPIDRCMEELRRAIELSEWKTVSSWPSWSNLTGTGLVGGEVDGHAFRLHRLTPVERWDAYPLGPVFFGALSEDEQGTRIVGYFDQPEVSKAFLALATGFSMLVAMLFIGGTVSDLLAGKLRPGEEAYTGLLLPTALLLLPILLYRFGPSLYGADQVLILNFLKYVFSARVETNSEV